MNLLYGKRELREFKKYMKDFSKRFKIVYNNRFDPYEPNSYRSIIEDFYLLFDLQ